jgi:ABC-2 type transport system ATP-binding protein
LNAEETLDFYGRLFDMPADLRKKRSEELIQMVGLKGARRQQLREYSKGMTRRIGLAQALINEPDLLILDEPTSGLDPIGSREMKDLILRLRDEGKTILMCSHQLADVQDVCDRIAILHRGRLRELGRVDDLLKVREVTEVHAKGVSSEVQAKIAELIRNSGGEVLSIDNPTTTMEELFLEIVRESEARPGMRTSASAKAVSK